MPKFLFINEFKKLSNDARVLYVLLRDRHQLSIKNNWINKNSEVYLIYTREEMASMLNVSNKTVLKAIVQLKKYELLDEDRQGLNKPNLIYLAHKDVENKGHVKITRQDMENVHASNTNINKTDNKRAKNNIELLELKRHHRKKNGDYSDYQMQTIADMAYIELRDKQAVST